MTSKRKIIIRFVRQNFGVVSLALASAFVSSLGSVLLPLSIGAFYELAYGDNSGKSHLLHSLGLEFSNYAGFFRFFALLVAVKGLTTWIELISMRRIEERFSQNLRKTLFHAQLNHEFAAFQSKSTGKYLLRYSSDMLAVQYYLSKGIIKCISDVLFLALAFTMLLGIDKAMALTLLIIFALSAVVMTLLSRLQQEPNERRRNARSSLISYIEQRLHAFSTIKAFNRAHPEESKFDKQNDKLASSAITFHHYNALNKSIPQVIFFFAVGTLLFMAVPANGVIDTEHGTLLVFILMLLYLQSAYRRLLRVPSLLNAGSTSFDNLLNLLNLEHEIMHSHVDVKELKKNHTIRFDNLTFCFNENHKLFSIERAELTKGHVYRITGTAGSGKSTLLKLLLKLYRPESNRLFIGNHDINTIGAHDLRRIMTIMSDDFPLVGKTIFEAVSYSRKEFKRDDAAQLLTRLGLTNNKECAAYLDRSIKPHGSDLSSNERRMLNFARAILTQKPIVLLDEPFLGMNTAMEQIIVSELTTMRTNRLIVLVCKDLPSNLQIDQTIQL